MMQIIHHRREGQKYFSLQFDMSALVRSVRFECFKDKAFMLGPPTIIDSAMHRYAGLARFGIDAATSRNRLYVSFFSALPC